MKQPQGYYDLMYPQGVDWRETKQCDSSCSHFDVINQCCWLVTGKSGLFTEVSEYDSCVHGFKEDS